MGQSGRRRWLYSGLDLCLPDAELSNVEIYEQAGACCVALLNFLGDHRCQGRGHLISTCDPFFNRVMLKSDLALWVSLFGRSVLIATPPTRKVGFCTLDALDGIAIPCFKIRPPFALWNQPD
jgi:hypothetical protein